MKLIRKTKIKQDGLNYWDITIPSTHNFVLANGVVVHNCGTGVGFSVERQEIKKLPLLPDKLTPCEFTIIVEDDKIGWAKAFDKLLRTLYDGYIPRWDISKVRGKGARLVTFGGRASGPGPLVDLFEHTIRIFSDAVAESQPQLYSIDVHSIVCKVGESIVSGGVRRSALISLSNPSDLRMRDAKSGDWWKEYQNPHFALANNSAAWTEKPSMQQFFDEWHALYKSRSGERGIFNRKAALLHAESLGRRVFIGSPGVNPCFIAGTLVATIDGPIPIEELVGKEPLVWTLDSNLRTKVGKMEDIRLTRENTPVVKVTYNKKSNGGKRRVDDYGEVTCTPDHLFMTRCGSWVAAKDLVPGIRLMPFSVKRSHRNDLAIRDGLHIKRSIHSYLAEYKYGRLIEDDEVVHHKDGNHQNNELSNLEIKKDSKHKSDHILGENNPNFLRQLPGAVWGKEQFIKYCEEIYNDLGRAPIQKEFIKLTKQDKAPSINHIYRKFNMSYSAFWEFISENHSIVSVEDAGLANVYDGSVPGTNNFAVCDKTPYIGHKVSGFFVHNCGEISLHSAQMCNLSECIARPNDTLESLIEKLEVATLFGIIQSTFTDFKYLRPEWKANTERERLLGVSITGIMGCPILNGIGTSREERNLNLDILRIATIKFTEKYSIMFGISMPAAITCIKPSGTVSKLVASDGDGIHAAKFRQGIRRFQENNVSPICTFLKDMGVPNEPLQSNPNHVTVFDFPLKYADTVVTKDEVTAIQMMENWYDFKKHWAEHSVSSTIDIREKEWLGVGDWVYRNFNEITGISFQPFDGGIYKNAPYHPLTPEEFEEFNSKFPQIHWNRLNHYEDDDNTEGSKELACVAGNCDV